MSDTLCIPLSIDGDQSLLPERVCQILSSGIWKGFEDGFLDLGLKGINDSMIFELCTWIIKLGDKIKVLRLKGNKLTSNGANQLFGMLRHANLAIREIDLSFHLRIDDECMKSLGEYIKYNEHIKEINLWNNNISDAGVEILTPYLNGNTTFKRIDFYSNACITEKSFPFIISMIESSHIEDINVNSTKMDQRNALAILLSEKALTYESNMLRLNYKDLDDEDLIKLCGLMKKLGVDKLKEIDLEGNKITSKGASLLFNTLKECNSKVSNLYLPLNYLDDDCMNTLGEYIASNSYLEILTIHNNNISDKGIEILCDHVIGNTVLRELHIGSNERITDKSTPYIIEIAKRSCIHDIDLFNASMSDEKFQEIQEILDIPIDEREIPIKSNCKSAAKVSI